MALQIELLESSFQAIASCGEAFVTAFYERLFTRFPHTRAFFASTDMKEQRKKLLGALALVIQHLRQPEVLTRVLTGLGQRHVTYGVQPEQARTTDNGGRATGVPATASMEEDSLGSLQT